MNFFLLHAADSTFSWAAWKKMWPKEKLDLKAVLQPTDSNLIRSVDVLDMRSEKSCLGLHTNKSYQPVAIIADTTFCGWMNTKLSNNSSGYNLILVVKNFWIIETHEYIYRDTKQLVQPDNNLAVEGRRVKIVPCTKLTCNFDVFVQKAGDYYPLVRLDTSLLIIQNSTTTNEVVIANALAILNHKISYSIYLNRYSSRKPATKESIVENYNKTFQIPILTDIAIKKGIYYTWDQFKRNKPDTIACSIKKIDSDLLLFVKNRNGIETIMQDAFALYDGTQLYRVYQGYVCNMYRDKNSFYWMGVGHVKVKNFFIPLALPLPGITVGGAESIAMKMKYLLFPYLLNHETGLPY